MTLQKTTGGGWAAFIQAITPEQQDQLVTEAVRALEQVTNRDLGDSAARLAAVQTQVQAAARRLGLTLSTELVADLSRQAAAQIGGLGFLEGLIYARPDVSEITLNPDGKVYVLPHGERFFQALPEQPDMQAAWRAAEALLTPLGRSLTEATPSVDAKLPRDPARNFSGARIKLIHPVITPGPGQVAGSLGYPSINIRKYEAKPVSPEKIVEWGMAPAGVVEGLVELVARTARVLVIGGTASGKTTLLCALCAGIPAGARIVTIEDPQEVFLDPEAHPNVVTLERRPASPGSSVPEYSIAHGVDDAMRMSPQWLIVGEVRKGDAAMSLFRAQMSDHPGLSTFHADGPHKAVKRMANIIRSDTGAEAQAAKETFAMAVDLIVQVGWRNQRRAILGAWEVAEDLRAGEASFKTLYEPGAELLQPFTRR